MIADNDGIYFTLAIDEQADLPVDFSGYKGQLPGKFIRDNVFRGDASVSQTLYLFDLCGSQARCISGNFIDGLFPFPNASLNIILRLYQKIFYDGA